MLDHVDPVNDLQNITVTGGRLNIYNSLLAINEYCLLNSVKVSSIPNSLISNLEVQPNPASDFLQLFYNLTAAGNITISVTDLSGRLVKSVNRQNFSEGFHSHIVDVQDLDAGIYFITLNIGETKSQVKKFIKN
jgi:hypothetical protein